MSRRVIEKGAPRFRCFFVTLDGKMYEKWSDGIFELSERSQRGLLPLPLSPKAYAREVRKKYLAQQERQLNELDRRIDGLDLSPAGKASSGR